MKLVCLIKRHLPDFCWQTSFEILTMLEQIDEDVSERSVRAVLSAYSKRGKILSREVHPIRQMNRQNYACIEYMGNPNWKAEK